MIFSIVYSMIILGWLYPADYIWLYILYIVYSEIMDASRHRKAVSFPVTHNTHKYWDVLDVTGVLSCSHYCRLTVVKFQHPKTTQTACCSVEDDQASKTMSSLPMGKASMSCQLNQNDQNHQNSLIWWFVSVNRSGSSCLWAFYNIL